jgi:hypothetical protein
MARTSQGMWEERLEELRYQADPEMDELVHRYYQDHQELEDVRSLVLQMLSELGEAKRNPAGEPATAAGQAVFADRGLYQSAALFFASLPMAYASDDGGAAALVRVSDLATDNLTRRVAETGQMLIDVMGVRGPDALQRGGVGYATAVGLRLLHACVRVILLDPDTEANERAPWSAERFGPPVNQKLLLATLLDFTLVTWQAMERMGVGLDDQDREAHLYT